MNKKLLSIKNSLIFVLLLLFSFSFGQTTQTYTTSGTFTVPVGVTSITVEAWGGGGGGQQGGNGGGSSGGGGGGYARSTFVVTPNSTYNYTVGAGGKQNLDGGVSRFGVDLLVASGGISGGSGGSANTGTITFKGGNGGVNSSSSLKGGAGGGGAAGTNSDGNNGKNATGDSGSSGGEATLDGGAGGNGGKDGEPGLNGLNPGGGGGGGGKQDSGGIGGNGLVKITYCPSSAGNLSGNQYICTYNSRTTTFSSTVSGGTWSSSNTLLATVNSSTGLITSVGTNSGVVTITYTVGGSGGCTLFTATRTLYVANGVSSNAVLTGSNLQCQGTTVNYTAAPVAGVSAYNWSYTGSGATISTASDGLSASISFSSTATSGNLKVTTTNGCATSTGGNEFWITINPIITSVPVATSASDIQCNYAKLNFTTVTNSNVTGVYLDIAKDNGFTNFLPGYNNFPVNYNNGSIPVDNLPAGILYYRVRGFNSCTTTANSNTVSFQTSAPLGGTVSPAQTICSGAQPFNLTLSGHSTVNIGILKWQRSTDAAFSNPIDINVTATTLTGAIIGNLTVNTYFRAIVRNQFGSWCETASTAALITININSVSPPSSTPTVCANSALTPITHTTSGFAGIFNGGISGANGLPTGVSAAFASNTITISGAPTTAGTYNYSIPLTGGGCGSGNAVGTITVNASSVAPTGITGTNVICNGSSTTLTLSGGTAGSGAVPRWYIGTCGGTLVGTGDSITVWPTVTTTYFVRYEGTCNITGCATRIVTINPIPTTPTVENPVQPTCAIATGSFTITNYNASYTYTFSPSIGISRTNDQVTASPGNYTIVASSASCNSESTTPIVIKGIETNTWRVTSGLGAWDNGTTPNKDQHLIFAGNFNSTKDVIGCDCTVNSGANVVFKYINPTLGHTLTVTNDVKVIGSGKLTFENNASLVQTADVITNTNTGKISYQRQTSPYKPFDYIYWSSPVAGQKLRDVSAQTPLDKFYSFDVAAYDWKQEDPNMIMKNGVGYIIRGPQYVLPIPPGLHQASFFGVPNNGLITVPIPSTAVNSESSALLGNPYPSALDANKLLRDNSSILEGTLYFWTHNTAIQDVGNITNGSQGSGALAYTSDDYATYNLTGGVTVVATGNILGGITQIVNKPSGKIASGQSFFAGIKAVAGTVKFENSMRVGVGGITGTNSQFFRTANKKFDATTTSENHRVWLNLTNTQGAFKQLLVGYITAATNAYDPSFDGVSFNGNEFIDFYSITGDETLTIQGRALPFDENDVVPLGYSSAIEGGFTISIDEVDGLFTSQNIFLEDKLNGSVHDLKKSGYTFETKIGTFDDRLVLRYTDKTLGVADLDQLEDQVIISKDKNELKIKSANETIKRVTIFDLLGKKVFDKEALDETEFRSSNVSLFKQTGIVKVTLATGQVISKKVAF
ncbi:hypothetical protein IWX83_000548 [Flavobacterium sp. CG_9.1]|uniref:glycine-rich domain-containing protein n=1 Tax=Flavobacterium sp. CG_9.1 TaxID=2787728 RepID=UPI0018C9B444|nr:T9SS sorting signal type C domain-containing protein [Flavobacterium sp. CG_9.1]MBG6060776.1 hypothetical protein [Flavobacterium sp. CG_9.1]